MERLVLSGFACSEESWIDFLGPETTVMSFADVLQATRSSDIRDWGTWAASELLRIRPDSIVCHDFGGVLGLHALAIMKPSEWERHACLSILNTAFRDFNVFKNPHPLLVQASTWGFITRLIRAQGGSVDDNLKPFFPLIKKAYRRTAVLSLARQIQKRIHPDRKAGRPLQMSAQIIASPSDPFIAMETIRGIERDFKVPIFHTMDYGHFPYASANRDAVRRLIYDFEASSLHEHTRMQTQTQVISDGSSPEFFNDAPIRSGAPLHP